MDFVLWSACVRTAPLVRQLDAAVAGGFTTLAITPETYRDTLASGMDAGEILALAEAKKIVIRYLDTVTAWSPVRFPADAHEETRRRFDFSMEECLEVCEALKLTTMLAYPGFEIDTVSWPDLVEGFATLCDRAADRGIWVDLEFTPLSGLPDLRSAYRIVRESGKKNCGIMLDTYHFLRGTADLDLLRSIPPERLVSVQLADASNEIEGGSLLEDCVHHRKLPGDGALPLLPVLTILREKGALRSIGPEIFSDELDRLAPEQAARVTADASRRILTKAGIDIGNEPDHG